jgi:hypothetical protein
MRRARVFCSWLVVGCAALTAGCGGDKGVGRYVPPTETARQALEAALRAWRDGRPPGKVETTAPEVVLVDNCRRPGQTLEGYTILGETPGEGPRCFAVRLLLQNPAEELRARFVVFGVDPLWVYRYEDYEMMIHWQCGQDEREDKTDRSPN